MHPIRPARCGRRGACRTSRPVTTDRIVVGRCSTHARCFGASSSGRLDAVASLHARRARHCNRGLDLFKSNSPALTPPVLNGHLNCAVTAAGERAREILRLFFCRVTVAGRSAAQRALDDSAGSMLAFLNGRRRACCVASVDTAQRARCGASQWTKTHRSNHEWIEKTRRRERALGFCGFSVVLSSQGM